LTCTPGQRAPERSAAAKPPTQDLTCWTQALLLDGDLALAEPKTLRYRLLHVAARLVRHARRRILRLQRSWPWAAELAQAFTRLRALPLGC
jgi:hypothetical protein